LPGYKQCKDCGQVKIVVEEFHKFGRRKSGKQRYDSRCKFCRAIYQAQPERRERARQRTAQWRKDNPERAREAVRQYHEAHREELNEVSRQYHIANREELNEKRRQYRKDHLEEERANGQRWRQANPEKVKKMKREYYESNRTKVLARGRQWRQANLERSKETARQWRKANRERVRELNRLRRIRKRGATGTFTEAQFQALCDYYGNVCLCCGQSGELTRDHVVPIVMGGSNYISNLQPLCKSCNSSKGTKDTDCRREK